MAWNNSITDKQIEFISNLLEKKDVGLEELIEEMDIGITALCLEELNREEASEIISALQSI